MSTAKMHKFSETGEVLAKTRPPPGHDHVSSGLLMPTFGWVVGWVLVWIGSALPRHAHLGFYDKNNIFTFFFVVGVILRMNGLCFGSFSIGYFYCVRC